MISKFHRFQWVSFLPLLLFVAGCRLNQAWIPPEGQKEFLQETSRLEKLAREHSDASVRAQSHLQLAFLYLDYRNPRLSYTRALLEMESYLSLAPTKASTERFLNWLAVLREVDQLRKKNNSAKAHIAKLQATVEKVQEANKGLREEVANLKELNSNMLETLEWIKSLDVQMEEKRSFIK